MTVSLVSDLEIYSYDQDLHPGGCLWLRTSSDLLVDS